MYCKYIFLAFCRTKLKVKVIWFRRNKYSYKYYILFPPKSQVKILTFLKICVIIKKRGDEKIKMNEIIEAISSLGFPIVMCIIMVLNNKEMYTKYNEQLYKIMNKHEEEIRQVTEAVNNNSVVINKLCERIEKNGVSD